MRAVLLLAIAACVDKGAGPQNKKIEPTYVTSHLVSAVPPDVTHLDRRRLVTPFGIVVAIGADLEILQLVVLGGVAEFALGARYELSVGEELDDAVLVFPARRGDVQDEVAPPAIGRG